MLPFAYGALAGPPAEAQTQFRGFFEFVAAHGDASRPSGASRPSIDRCSVGKIVPGDEKMLPFAYGALAGPYAEAQAQFCGFFELVAAHGDESRRARRGP